LAKKTDDDIDADAPAETLTEGAIVKAHFKAKGKDGKTGKSRKPREARVQSMNDDLVTVQFLSNGVRHNIPRTWIVDQDGPRIQKQTPTQTLDLTPPNPTRVARGELVISLLQAEAEVIGVVFNMHSRIVKMGMQILKDSENGSFQQASAMRNQLRMTWEQEHDVISQHSESLEET